MPDLFSELRFVVRGLRRDRTFSLAVIVMLALGIGFNLTVFAIMNAMLFRGFPLVKDNSRLVYIQEQYPSGACCLSYLDFQDWRSQASAFEDMAFVGVRPITFSDGGGPSIDMIPTPPTITTNTFRLLGVRPMLGRDFVSADEASGASPVAIISYEFWDRHFDRRSDIVGVTVRISKVATTIVGVMPQGFTFPLQEHLWLPLVHTPALLGERHVTTQWVDPGGYIAFGRLRDGVTLEQARAQLKAINQRLAEAYPATNRGVVPKVGDHSQTFVGPDAPVIYGSMWAGAWFVFLIACVNVSNLTLARNIGRSQSFATRLALGAGSAHLVRHIVMESLMLACIAAALGWWLAEWSVRTWSVATASSFEILDYSRHTATTALLATVSVVAVLLSSLPSALRVVRGGANRTLKSETRGVAIGRGRVSVGLVVGQMALAIVLLSAAGVLVRSLLKVVMADTGVRDSEKILVGSVRLPSDTYPSSTARLQYFDRLEARLKTIPGVEDTSVATALPVRGGALKTFEMDGRRSEPGHRDVVEFLSVGSGYFQVMGAPATAGRDFNDGDHDGALPVAVVNRSFVSTFWPDQQAVGRQFRVWAGDKADEWRTIVGVVPNIMEGGGNGLRQQFKPVVYVPFRQEPAKRAFLLLRMGVPPSQAAREVRAEIQKLDPYVVLDDVNTLKANFAFRSDAVDRAHTEMGKNAAVAPILASIALLLAAIGLYAVVEHSVRQRTREIGIRIAIGAQANDILNMVVRDGMRLTAIGVIVGLVLSLAVNRVLRSQLVGVSPYDPIAMASAPLILILVTLMASYLPARRTVNVDPVVALRHE